MSNEDRQRILRRAGSEPAEAQTQQQAQDSREAEREGEAELRDETEDSPKRDGQQVPLAEDPEGPPRPRR